MSDPSPHQQHMFQVTPPDGTPQKKRWRGQFKFWLDAMKPDEMTLGQKLTALKAKRQYTPTIRDALTLIFELREGKTDALKRMFPGIVAALQAEVQPRPASEDFNEILSRLDQLQSLQGEPQAGPKKMAVPSLQAPDDDEDDDLFTPVETSNVNASQNFVNSVLALR